MEGRPVWSRGLARAACDLLGHIGQEGGVWRAPCPHVPRKGWASWPAVPWVLGWVPGLRKLDHRRTGVPEQEGQRFGGGRRQSVGSLGQVLQDGGRGGRKREGEVPTPKAAYSPGVWANLGVAAASRTKKLRPSTHTWLPAAEAPAWETDSGREK